MCRVAMQNEVQSGDVSNTDDLVNVRKFIYETFNHIPYNNILYMRNFVYIFLTTLPFP